jgi:hypothetical protein
MGVLENMDVDTLDTFIQTPAECKVTKVCSDQCPTKAIFFYDIAEQVTSGGELGAEAFNLVCVQRKWNPKEKFLSNVHKRMKAIIIGKTRPPMVKAKLQVKTEAQLAALKKNDPNAKLNMFGWFYGMIPNVFLGGEYRDISVANLNCVKENLMYFRRLDKQCDDDPASVARLTREANFDFKAKCGKMTPGELKSQEVLSRILAESFLFLIKSSDEVSGNKFCQCRDFRKFEKSKKKELQARRKKAVKTPDATLEQDQGKFAEFSKKIDGYFATANENCKTNKADVAKTTKQEKKERSKKLKTERKDYEKGKKNRIDTFNQQIQDGLAKAYAGLPWKIPTMKEWKADRAGKKAIAKATKAALKAAEKGTKKVTKAVKDILGSIGKK